MKLSSFVFSFTNCKEEKNWPEMRVVGKVQPFPLPVSTLKNTYLHTIPTLLDFVFLYQMLKILSSEAEIENILLVVHCKLFQFLFVSKLEVKQKLDALLAYSMSVCSIYLLFCRA